VTPQNPIVTPQNPVMTPNNPVVIAHNPIVTPSTGDMEQKPAQVPALPPVPFNKITIKPYVVTCLW
jgi:hypothetical protein